MAKLALLIGVSDYEPGLNPLPGSVKDIEAVQRVLKHAEMGGFDHVKTLSNPEPTVMQEAIEALFSGCSKEDLALLFFSGHGVKDDSGRFYFATRATRKNLKGELVKATAVPASFVQDIMANSRSKRQIVILDCCFSGAFAEGMTAKDDGIVDVQTQLGGEGRAVLTSSTSTQYSFEQQGSDLSVYTRYFVEGIETGAADRDGDGSISIDELHEYTQKKVQEAAPAMKPKIYAAEEGFKIRLAQAPTNDPQLSYRREVERCASRGKISHIGRSTLDAYQEELALPTEVAHTIEAEVLKPYQERQRKLQRYEQVLQQAIEREKSLSDATCEELKHLQKALGLRDEDVAPLAARMPRPFDRALQSSVSGSEKSREFNPLKRGSANRSPVETSLDDPPASRKNTTLFVLAGGALTAVLVGLGSFVLYPPTPYPQLKTFLEKNDWKNADEETAQIIWKITGRQQEKGLRAEDFAKIPCADLRNIDDLWGKYSNQQFGFAVQKRIWLSTGVNGDLNKFIAQVGWAGTNKDGSFVYWLMDGQTFDLSMPKGKLPWAVTYNGGNNETRERYMAQLIKCLPSTNYDR
jgi:GUN4-like/Caspase domain